MSTTQSEAIWNGTLREGNGTMKVASGYFEGPYTFATRFEGGAKGTNPEELIGAAHAGCYSMFLSAVLTRNQVPPTRIDTRASVHLEDGPTITRIVLDVAAVVPDLDEATFQEYAQEAKAKCPVSKALAGGPEIVLNARLVS